MKITRLFCCGVLAFLGGGTMICGCGRHKTYRSQTESYSHNGAIISEANSPFIVKLVLKNSDSVRLVCGGIAIRDHWVLTAAHCVRSNGLMPTHVVAAGSPTKFLEFKPYCHPHFSRGASEDTMNDLALLKITGGGLTAWTGKILEPPKWPSGKSFVVLGWGRPNPETLMRSPPMPHVEKTLCEAKYRDQIVQDNEICAGSQDSAPCQLDSGGALFTANVWPLGFGFVSLQDLVGVVSQADDDCVSVGPGIHAGVDADSLKWIDDIIQDARGVRATSAGACIN